MQASVNGDGEPPSESEIGQDDGDMALDIPCPDCGEQMYPEQAHNRCPACLYIEPCCDGAPQACQGRVVSDASRCESG